MDVQKDNDIDRKPISAGSRVPQEEEGARPVTHVRTAIDASDHKGLARDPSDDNAKLDVALDESFPTSDAPSNTQPGKGKDPAPSSGYDAEAEERRSDTPKDFPPT